MFKKVLIANRGEIALRVVRACREMGIRSAAVYSEADREAAHVRLADEAVCIGPASSARSYLNQPNILAAAKILGAGAVHPGYGFLAENAGFAERCAAEGLVFIGPGAKAIRRLGDKAAARALAKKCGVPVIPGTEGCVRGKAALAAARRIGFPVMIKAALGGGGKGLRLARRASAFERELALAQNEARAAFGDDSVYIEKLIEKPRHVEVQIARDRFGNAAAFPERDCSVQRRHQKLVEESPSPAVDEALRSRLMEAALKLAHAADYQNFGTVEFLLTPDKKFYFIEVNARLQVEHPVTEAVTGIDAVREQIRIAMGEKLSFSPAQARQILGHAIEHRINAEDPERGFAPSPGAVTTWITPGGPGVRLDTHVYGGYSVPSTYDSLLGKLIIHAPDRDRAIARGRRALGEFCVAGISTTIDFHKKLLENREFRSGQIDTGFLERFLSEGKHEKNHR